MAIEKRTAQVDLNQGEVNSNYRAALHSKLSQVEPDGAELRRLVNEDFTKPLDPNLSRLLNQLKNTWFDQDKGRQFIELSPIGPFGIDSFLTKTSPLKVAHATGRTADVVADPTIQLAAEVYRQRSTGSQAEINLGTSHRCLRLQRYQDPTFTPSFEMAGTIDSTQKADAFFEEGKVRERILFYANFFQATSVNADLRISLGNIRLSEKLAGSDPAASADERIKHLEAALPDEWKQELTPTEAYSRESMSLSQELSVQGYLKSIQRLYESLPEPLKDKTTFALNRVLGLGHYDGPVFMVHVNGLTLVDGGSVNWLAKLTSNKKERAVVSGFGIELYAKLLAAV